MVRIDWHVDDAYAVGVVFPCVRKYREIYEERVVRARGFRSFSDFSCKAAASGSCQNEIRQRRRLGKRGRQGGGRGGGGNAHETRDDRCDRPSSAPTVRENLRKYSTCKFIEILRTPALRREMYSRRSGDTRTKSASLYCHSAPFESIA